MFFFSTLKIFKFNFFKLIFMYHIHLCDIDFFLEAKICSTITIIQTSIRKKQKYNPT